MRTEMNATNLFGLGFGGIGGTDGTTAQWYAKASDGKLYAGGGNVTLDANGMGIAAGSGSASQIKWTSSGSTYASINTVAGASTSLYVNADPNSLATDAQIVFNVKGTGVVPAFSLTNLSSGGTAADLYAFNTFTWERSLAGGTIALIGMYDKDTVDTTIGNVATEQTLYSKSISGGDLGTSSGIRAHIQGIWTNNTGANRTLTVRIKFGETTLVSPSMTLTPSATNGHFEIVVHLFNTATNAQRAMAKVEFRRGSAIIDAGWNSNITSAENTTAAKTFTVTVRWDLANANATLTQKIAYIELLQ